MSLLLIVQIYQTTIKDRIILEGYAVHSAQPSTLIISPAPPNTRIVFKRVDEFGEVHTVQANYKNVYKTSFCSGLKFGDESRFTLDTVEHLLAAIFAFGIDNLLIEVNADEVPIFDGSANYYCKAFKETGLVQQNEKRDYYKINEHIRLEVGNKYIEIIPYDGIIFDVTVDFDHKLIGKQRVVFDVLTDDFCHDIASARTFGFIENVNELWASGMALGSSLENSIVLSKDGSVINKNGLRYDNEFARHKLLDVMGDISLLGRPFIGKVVSYCAGHEMNVGLVKKIVKTIV